MVFSNRNTKPLTLIVEPSDREYEIPFLAELGVRYTPAEGADRSYSTISGDRIYYWCDVEYEVDLVLPTRFDKLLWDLCVGQGFCGGLTEEREPIHVTDLLPKEGVVSADEFAALAMRAEGWPWPVEGDEGNLRWVARLKALFVEHMGATTMPAEALTQRLTRPFESDG